MDYIKELEGIKYTIGRFSETDRPEYKIEYCDSAATSWTIAAPKTDEIKRFTKNAQDIIEMFTPDALKITVYIKGIQKLTKFVKITDTHIPLVDSKVKTEPVQNENFQGFGEVQRTADKYENDIRFMKFEHESDIRVYRDRIRRLEEKLEATEGECAEFASEVEDLQKELEQAHNALEKKSSAQSQLATLGSIKILGKVFKIPETDIQELSGLVINDNEEFSPAEHNKGGFEIEEVEDTNPERTAKQNSIMQWMKSLDDSLFARFFAFMTIITHKSGAFDTAVKAVNDIETDTNQEKGGEND